jgi:hypothetical protein
VSDLGPSASARGRAWLGAAGAVALAAAAVRVHNAFAFPPLDDPDGPGHVLNVFAIREGGLPSPTSWSGFHPPLYHAAGALLWALAPEAIPVHVLLRLLSAAAGFAAVFVLWRALRKLAPGPDAAIVAAFALGVPVFAIATSTLGNETTGALCVTLVLARLMQVPGPGRGGVRHALGTAACLTLALLAKATGGLAVAVAAATYVLRQRREPRRALACALLVIAVPVALAAPHYLRIAAASRGDPLAFVSGAGLSPDLAFMMSRQPPGERSLGDYAYLPIATLVAPNYQVSGLVRSVPGLLYASVWADAHDVFLGPVFSRTLLAQGPVSPRVLHAQAASAILGLVPSALALAGVVRLVRRRDARAFAPLLFAALLLGSALRYTWILPQFSAVKASYLLPAALPACLALQAGLDGLGGRARAALRAVLLGLSLFGTVLTCWTCWH